MDNEPLGLRQIALGDLILPSPPNGEHGQPPNVPESSDKCAVRCPDCQDAGWYLLAVPYGHPSFGQLQSCACGQAAAAARVAKQSQLHNELGSLAACTFESFDEERALESCTWDGETFSPESQRYMLQTAVSRCRDYANSPEGWLYVHGHYGAGKSHLAAAIAHELAAQYAVLYRNVPGLIDDLRAGYKAGTYDERIETVISSAVLVLDDLGAEQMSGNAETLLFRILNERLLQSRLTIITSNIHPDDLPGRLSSRIARAASCVWMPISDYGRLKVRTR